MLLSRRRDDNIIFGGLQEWIFDSLESGDDIKLLFFFETSVFWKES